MTEDQKPHSVGHVDHGKATLTAAITFNFIRSPEEEALKKRVEDQMLKRYSNLTRDELYAYQNPPRTPYRGGKAARKMQRRNR